MRYRRKSTGLLILLGLAACGTPAPAPAPPPPVAAPARPAAPRAEPDLFLGLQPTQLRALLGPPAFTRKDGATEMWRYDIPACRGIFFFIGTPAKVSHVDTLPQGPGNVADPACLKALRVSLPAKRS